MNKTHPSEIKKHLIRNLFILALSSGAAVYFAWSGIFAKMILYSNGFKYLESLVSGFFFTSVLTTGVAAVALGELARYKNILEVALIGAAGSVIGDIILFRFVKDSIADDFLALLKLAKPRRLKHLFKLSFFHWLLPVLGALVVASPLPDEIGLAMMGVSKLSTGKFILISYTANFFGILLIGWVARQL